MNTVKKVIYYDTETTGLPDWKNPSGSDSQPHLVQIAAILCNEDTGEILQELDAIIKPDGWVIPDDVAEIHGITTEIALEKGVDEKYVVTKFLGMWFDGVSEARRVAHNKTFDMRIIRIALKRYFDESVQDKWAIKDTHDCTMLMAKPIMEMLPKNRFGFKNPKLEEALEFFTGEELQDAHTAMADTVACMKIYLAMKAGKGKFNAASEMQRDERTHAEREMEGKGQASPAQQLGQAPLYNKNF